MKRSLFLRIVPLVLLLGGCMLPHQPPPLQMLQISGQVVDAKTGKPVEGARVWISGHLKTKISTDKDGLFLTQPDRSLVLAFDGKPLLESDIHSFVLVVELNGYLTREIDVSALLAEGDPVFQPVRELEKPVQLQPRESPR